MTVASDADAVQRLLAAGTALAAPRVFDTSEDAELLAAVVPDGYTLACADLSERLAPLRDAPRRTTGTVTVLDAAHRIVLRLDTTPAWQRWTRLDRRLVGQAEYAEHIEDALPDILDPPAAAMLELVQSFEAASKVAYKSAHRLATGERRLVYEETTTARAGQRGEIDIPTRLAVRLQPYRAAAPVDLAARFRYRIDRDGALLLGHVLDDPEGAREAAFARLVAEIQAEHVDTPILMGPAR